MKSPAHDRCSRQLNDRHVAARRHCRGLQYQMAGRRYWREMFKRLIRRLSRWMFIPSSLLAAALQLFVRRSASEIV